MYDFVFVDFGGPRSKIGVTPPCSLVSQHVPTTLPSDKTSRPNLAWGAISTDEERPLPQGEEGRIRITVQVDCIGLPLQISRRMCEVSLLLLPVRVFHMVLIEEVVITRRLRTRGPYARSRDRVMSAAIQAIRDPAAWISAGSMRYQKAAASLSTAIRKDCLPYRTAY